MPDGNGKAVIAVATGHVCGHDSQSAAQGGSEHKVALTQSSEHEISQLGDEVKGYCVMSTGFHQSQAEQHSTTVIG